MNMAVNPQFAINDFEFSRGIYDGRGVYLNGCGNTNGNACGNFPSTYPGTYRINSSCNPCNSDPLYNPSLRGPSAIPGPTIPGTTPNPLVNPFGPRRMVTTWKINYLVAPRLNHAAHLDIELVNSWGIVVYNNQLWVANGTTDKITNYDLFGNKLLGAITVRDAAHNSSFPTGLVVNCGNGFSVTNGSISRTATLLTATEHGTLHAYNPAVDPLNAYIVINQQITGEVSVFKGLALANNIVYLANFFQMRIDVFNSDYVRLLGFNFIDGDTFDPIPLDFGPNNIVYIGCYLYVLWAKRDPNVPIHGLHSVGLGFVSVFNLDGSFVRRFASRGVLNSPWAMIPAPPDCGFPSCSFLIGNNGDGRINAFDSNGRYLGPLLDQEGKPVAIEGLWGLAPHYTSFSEIFYASAADEDTDGLVGSLVKDQSIFF